MRSFKFGCFAIGSKCYWASSWLVRAIGEHILVLCHAAKVRKGYDGELGPHWRYYQPNQALPVTPTFCYFLSAPLFAIFWQLVTPPIVVDRIHSHTACCPTERPVRLRRLFLCGSVQQRAIPEHRTANPFVQRVRLFVDGHIHHVHDQANAGRHLCALVLDL